MLRFCFLGLSGFSFCYCFTCTRVLFPTPCTISLETLSPLQSFAHSSHHHSIPAATPANPFQSSRPRHSFHIPSRFRSCASFPLVLSFSLSWFSHSRATLSKVSSTPISRIWGTLREPRSCSLYSYPYYVFYIKGHLSRLAYIIPLAQGPVPPCAIPEFPFFPSCSCLYNIYFFSVLRLSHFSTSTSFTYHCDYHSLFLWVVI